MMVTLTLVDDTLGSHEAVEVNIFGSQQTLPPVRQIGDICRLHRATVRGLRVAVAGGRRGGARVRRFPGLLFSLACVCVPTPLQVNSWQGRFQLVGMLNRSFAYALFSAAEARGKAPVAVSCTPPSDAQTHSPPRPGRF